MLRKSVVGVILGTLAMSLVPGVNLAQLPVAFASTFASKQAVIVTDGSTTFERLAAQRYDDDRRFDRDLDRLGQNLAVSFEHPDNAQLPTQAETRIKSRMASANAALVVPISVVRSDVEMLEIAKGLLGTGKSVYLYGSDVTPEEVEKLFGVNATGRKAVPDPEDVQKYVEEKATRKNYTVIGVASSAKGTEIRMGSTHMDAPNPDTIREDVLRWLVVWELDEPNRVKPELSDAFKGRTAKAAETIVASFMQKGTTWYASNGKIKGTIYVDWHLRKRTDETEPTYDYFALDPRYNLKDGIFLQANGWDLIGFDAKHTMAWSSDQLMDWSPGSQSTSQFSVSLPDITASWTFDLNTTHTLTTSADINQVFDWAKYEFDYHWSGPYNLEIPFQVKPGTGWASTGTYAGIDTTHSATFLDMWNSTYVETWSDTVRYDY